MLSQDDFALSRPDLENGLRAGIDSVIFVLWMDGMETKVVDGRDFNLLGEMIVGHVIFCV